MSWHLHNRNPLIVNIACGSSTQDIQLGDELLGLPTAWLIAGARVVVGTLWPIQSRDGRRFTEEFYGELESARRKGGLDRMVNLAVALQKAVLKMRDDEEMQAPYHWMGFVLQGAWEMDFRE
jgi:CHAT domain-containing protein